MAIETQAKPQQVVNVHAAKTHFSKLLARVEKGEEVIIARAGKPVARLMPIAPEATKTLPKFGALKGSVLYMADDFDAPMPEFEDAFYNGPLMTSEEDLRKFQEEQRRKETGT